MYLDLSNNTHFYTAHALQVFRRYLLLPLLDVWQCMAYEQRDIVPSRRRSLTWVRRDFGANPPDTYDGWPIRSSRSASSRVTSRKLSDDAGILRSRSVPEKPFGRRPYMHLRDLPAPTRMDELSPAAVADPTLSRPELQSDIANMTSAIFNLTIHPDEHQASDVAHKALSTSGQHSPR